jgi:hydrogenase expression/formation protein HypD
MELLLGVGDLHIDGFIAPGHVSTIIGLKPYEIFPKAYRMPIVVAGFEPLDVLFAISMLLQQVRNREAKLENEYIRAVSVEGNMKAQELINVVFDVTDGNWRGIGRLPCSALALKKEFDRYDARKKYDLQVKKGKDILLGCMCHLVMIGKIRPNECPLFMKECKPTSPRGACMVSIEGTCHIWARYKTMQSESF